MLKSNVRLTKNDIGKLARTGRNVQDVLMEAAFDVEARAKRNIVQHDLVDTGALLNSVQASETSTGARVTVGQHYGVYHELGTRHHPARPFLVPAFEEVKGDLQRRLRGAVDL